MCSNGSTGNAKSQILDTVELMNAALTATTGTKEVDRKTIIYYTLATHSLPQRDTYPMLGLLGKTGTGKTETEMIISRFAYSPRNSACAA